MDFHLLSNQKRKEMFSAALTLLEETGLKLESEEVKAKLGEQGARISGDRLFLPENLVRKCMNSAPNEISVRTRNGLSNRLGKEKTIFGLDITGSFTDKNVIKNNDGTIGPADIIKLTNELPNISLIAITPQVFTNDTLESKISLLEKMFETSNKPIILGSSKEKAREKEFDFFIDYATQNSINGEQKVPSFFYSLRSEDPLRKSKIWIKHLNRCLENGLPVILEAAHTSSEFVSMNLSQKTTLGLTELLGSITIAQTLQPGSPVILGTGFPETDFEGKENSLGLGYSSALTSCLAEAASFSRIPVLARNSTRFLDWYKREMYLDSTLNFLVNYLVRTDLFTSRIGSKKTGGYPSEFPVIIDEMVGMIKRVCRGVSTDKNDLALDLISQVGHKGDYITAQHTLERFKTEHWQPSILDRQNFESWSSNGEKDLTERARERAKEILTERKNT
jgi:trimethylamine--corrinoid protein Co-methyltransferase